MSLFRPRLIWVCKSVLQKFRCLFLTENLLLHGNGKVISEIVYDQSFVPNLQYNNNKLKSETGSEKKNSRRAGTLSSSTWSAWEEGGGG